MFVKNLIKTYKFMKYYLVERHYNLNILFFILLDANTDNSSLFFRVLLSDPPSLSVFFL